MTITKQFNFNFFFYLLIFLSFQKAYAEDVPNLTYLWGSSDPKVAFDHGISARGLDYDLMDALAGNAFSEGTSGYVATGANLPAMLTLLEHALKHASPDQPSEYWVYSIRPAGNFYNALHSVIASAGVAEHDGDLDLLDDLHIIYEQMTTSPFFNSIFVARNQILPTQIQSATQYRLVNNRITAITTRLNPNYINLTPAVNPDNILITQGSDQYIFYSDLGTGHILPGAFCESFFSNTSLVKSSTEGLKCNKQTYQALKLKLRQIFTVFYAD